MTAPTPINLCQIRDRLATVEKVARFIEAQTVLTTPDRAAIGAQIAHSVRRAAPNLAKEDQ